VQEHPRRGCSHRRDKGSTVYLGFLATSAYGNNIFLDDALVVGQ
jgi:hypothetical protein